MPVLRNSVFSSPPDGADLAVDPAVAVTATAWERAFPDPALRSRAPRGTVSTAALAAPVASPATIADNAKLAATLNWDDKLDFDFASRGYIGGPADPVVRDRNGAMIRDFREDAVFKGPAPATVNPSLWRNATLLAKHGLFQVADGIWQVRGYDLSNMTIIRGKTGWILVDPLTTAEIAAAALALVNEKLGTRPVTGVSRHRKNMAARMAPTCGWR